jgi:hypothetical protein
MFQQFVNALAENLADILTVTAVIAVIAGVVLYAVARSRHVAAIRRRIGAEVPVPDRVKETLGRVFNADVAEVSAIGAVSFVDIAWQYSMADPSIWDHFQGPAATHMADAIQNLDVLKSTLGDHTLPFVDSVIEYLRSLEAMHVFADLAGRIPALGDSTAILLDAKTTGLVDSLASGGVPLDSAIDGKASAAGDALLHIPLVTIGFATYRAWRRAQRGAGLRRNVEFAAIEVTTRAGGGLVGGKLGGAVGTAIAPGVGTVIGVVAGAVAGAVGGAVLGEAVKRRHVQKASRDLNESLDRLGEVYLNDINNFDRVKGVFVEHEQKYISSLQETRRRLRRYAMPWRVVWPDEKLVLLQATVRLAEDRLGTVKAGTADAIDRLKFLQAAGKSREMGLLLWNNPALCSEVPCDAGLVSTVREANDRLHHEIAQLGRQLEAAPA